MVGKSIARPTRTATPTAGSAKLYRHWRQQLDVVLRQEHKAEKLFVDYAGDTNPVHDPQSSPQRQASIFVAVLGASNYAYAEATESQEPDNWIGSHIRAFEFFQGVPKLCWMDGSPYDEQVYLKSLNGTARHCGSRLCCCLLSRLFVDQKKLYTNNSDVSPKGPKGRGLFPTRIPTLSLWER